MSHERSPHLQDDEKTTFRVRTDVLDAKAANKAARDAAFTAGLKANAEERPRGSRMTVPVVVEAPAPVVEATPEPGPVPVAQPDEPPPAFVEAAAPPAPEVVEAAIPAPKGRAGKG